MITPLRRGFCDFTNNGELKEPLPYNKGVMALVAFRDFIILLSQSTPLTFKRMQKKLANVLLKFSDMKPLSPKIRRINQQLLSEKRQLVTRPGPTLPSYVAELPSVLSFLLSFWEALWRRSSEQRYSYHVFGQLPGLSA